MSQQFSGFSREAIEWFAGLELENTRAYFERSRDVFETTVKEPLALMFEELRQEFGGTIKIFRQNRDIRFSKDKSPYKTNRYGILAERPGSYSALYASISANGLYAGTGYHEMAKDQLARYRAAVVTPAGDELARRVTEAADAGLQISGDQLKTVPRGYPRDHVHVDLLRRTSLIAGTTLAPGSLLASRGALTFVADTWRAAMPMLEWLDRHVGASIVPPEVRLGRGRVRRAAVN